MRLKIFATTACLFMFAHISSVAQSNELELGPESKLWIDGTSNKSDWTVTATEMSGTLVLDADGNPAQATVSVAADKIESNKSKIMDRLMYRALKTQAHPIITYTLTSVAGADEVDSLSTSGEVEVAGVKQSAPLKVEWLSEDAGAGRVRGSHAMKMSDHGMKPPTAMFGALHTANEVTVHFDVVFAPAGTTASGS